MSLVEFKSQSFDFPKREAETTERRSFTVIKRAKGEADLAEVSSLYSEPCFETDRQISGRIKLGTWYNEKEEILYVRIAQADSLAASTNRGSLNPYVVIYLLPEEKKQNKRRTGVQHGTNTPQYDEIFKVQ